MKKVMASMLVWGTLVSAVYAQTVDPGSTTPAIRQSGRAPEKPPVKHKTPDEWVSELDAVVGLSADQKVQAKALAVKNEADRKALREEAKTLGEDAAKQKRMRLMKEQKEALDKILDETQRAKWKAHRESMRAEHGGAGRHKTPEQAVAELDAVVGLTADQKIKAKELAEAKDAKMKALVEAQRAKADEKAFMEKRQQIGREYRAELDGILTATQKAALKAHRDAVKAKQGKPSIDK